MGSKLKLLQVASLFFGAGATWMLDGQAFAQSITAPPRQDTNSATGVSYRSGALTYSEQDLSVGGGFPSGLSLSRSYNSSVAFSLPGHGWTFSVNGYVSIDAIPVSPDGPAPDEGAEPYVYNVVFGGKSVGFLGGSVYTGLHGVHTGGPVGTYTPALPSGASLVFNGSTAAGYYTFTDADGTVVNFTTGPSGRISNWTLPDGTRLDYTYVGGGGVVIQNIISNRGWALIFDGATKVCAVNMTRSYVTSSTSTCPTDAQTVTYATTSGSFNAYVPLLTSATRGGRTTNYTYNSKDHLNCVKEPGQTACKVQSTYTECLNDPAVVGIQQDRHYHDYVTSQVDAASKTYGFSYGFDSCPKWQSDTSADYRPFSSNYVTMQENGSTTLWVTAAADGNPNGITDALSHATSFSYQVNSTTAGVLPDGLLVGVYQHEGNHEDDTLDARGNIVTKTVTPKPGSGLAAISSTASYSSSCSNIFTCNKPAYVIDANGNRTDYSYDSSHGGVLTETGPADASGVHPVKRYAYAQRYAWILNASSTYSAAATPVWVKTEERYCRTTATVSGACAGGSSDEVVTAYDYGPNSGPNNLLLRGIAVTADGTTRRTCYGYDRDGNRIWETKSRAGLTSCP